MLALLDEVPDGLEDAGDDDEEDDIAGAICVMTDMMMNEFDYLMNELVRARPQRGDGGRHGGG